MAGHGHFIHKIDRFEPNVQTPTNNHPLAMDRDVNRAGILSVPHPRASICSLPRGIIFPIPVPTYPHQIPPPHNIDETLRAVKEMMREVEQSIESC